MLAPRGMCNVGDMAGGGGGVHEAINKSPGEGGKEVEAMGGGEFISDTGLRFFLGTARGRE